MKPKNPFSIVDRPVELTFSREQIESSIRSALKKQSKTLSIDQVPPGLMEALVSSSSLVQPKVEAKPAKQRKAKPVASTKPNLSAEVLKVVERAASGTIASTVGILDLGAWVSRLPDLLKVMNKSQDALVFLELQTPVPAGLVKTKEPLVKWAQQKLRRPLQEQESQELLRNMLADEFFYFAESVRVRNKLDFLIGLTPAMIAFEDDDGPKWNYSVVGSVAGKEDVAVVSTCDLREFAMKAGRPYEAAIGMLIAAQVLAKRNDMKYHPETRGCIFDFNNNPADIIVSIRGMSIDADCMSHFKDKDEAKNAKRLVAALSRMKEPQHG
jgi:hypothetical protein